VTRHCEGDRFDFEHLGDIGIAELAQRSTTVRAAALTGRDHVVLAVEVLGQSLAPHRLLGRVRARIAGARALFLSLDQRDGELLERERHLAGALELLGGLAEAKATELGDLELQVLDLTMLLDHQTLQGFGVVRQLLDIEHAEILDSRTSNCTRKTPGLIGFFGGSFCTRVTFT